MYNEQYVFFYTKMDQVNSEKLLSRQGYIVK